MTTNNKIVNEDLLVEKVARAIYEKNPETMWTQEPNTAGGYTRVIKTISWEDIEAEVQEQYLIIAQAAIDAMQPELADDITVNLYKALSAMLIFYGMDLDISHEVQKKTHEDAQAACTAFTDNYRRTDLPQPPKARA